MTTGTVNVDAVAGLVVEAIKNATAPLHARISELEAREVKDGAPGPRGEKGDVGPVGPEGPEGPAGRDGRDGMAGVPGRDGLNGKDGAPGKDGLDGLGFDDLDVVHDGERGFTFRFTRGDRVKEFPFTVPALIYRGVFVEGKEYARGDTVTWAGASWHCHTTTTAKPGDGSKDWQLMVKRGAEGKAGRDGRDLRDAPVVSIGGRK